MDLYIDTHHEHLKSCAAKMHTTNKEKLRWLSDLPIEDRPYHRDLH